METNDVILYQDELAAETSTRYYKVKYALIKAISEMKALGVEPSNEIIQDLLSDNTEPLTGSLTKLLQNRAGKEDLAYLKDNIMAKLPALLSEGNSIVFRFREQLKKCSCFDHCMGKCTLDPALFSFVNGTVGVNEKPILDQYLVYINAEEMNQIKSMVSELNEKLAAFNSYIQEVSSGKIKGFKPMEIKGKDFVKFL
jgi:hypothetical protein